MRSAVSLALVAVALAGGCNRLHIYKTQGQAAKAAFAEQAAPHTAPAPRGLDGEEAAGIIAAQKRATVSEDEKGAAPGKSGLQPAAGVVPLMLQSK